MEVDPAAFASEPHPDMVQEPDEFAAQLEAAFTPDPGEEAPSPEEDVDGEGEEGGEEEEAPSGEDTSASGEGEQPPPPAEAIRLGEIEIPAERAGALGQFYAWAQTDEGSAWVQFLGSLTEAGLSPQQVAAFLKPQGEGGTAAPPTPEDEYTDPDIAALREQITAQNTQLEQLQQRVQQNAIGNMSAIIAKATNDFVSRHGLTGEEMEKVKTFTEARNLVGGIQGTDAHSALMEAFETAYWAMPDFREKELQRQQDQKQAEAKKNRKLAAVGGTNGSTRAKPKSVKAEDITRAMADELAEHMGFPSRTG
jgi:DNA-binding transcriptional MerR regulator